MLPKKTKIIIIGAGIAGLAAANELSKHCDVRILEARHRPGGRIWIDHSLGTPLSRGAAWVHGIENNPLTKLATQFPTKLHFLHEKRSYYFDRNGSYIDEEKIANFNQKMEVALEQSQQLALAETKDIPLSIALSRILPIKNFSPIEQDIFERQLRFFENYVGAEWELLSARHWNEEEDFSSRHAFLGDSYAAILNGLSASCSIQFNTIVKAIQEEAHHINVLTDQATFSADVVIVTLPLGVLKQGKVQFEPSLSSSKQKAIERLGMGLFNIIAMRFNSCFWPEDGRGFFLPTPLACSMFLNLKWVSGAPILLGYVGGKTASALEKQSDTAILEETVANLKKFFKKDISIPENYFITRWSQDPFSLGSYSYLPVGATRDDRDTLAQPESDRLFFAGEATSREFPATVHGAYLSGLREAERIKSLYCTN